MSEKKISEEKIVEVEPEIKIEPEENSQVEKVNKKAIKIRHGKTFKKIFLQGLQLFIGAAIASVGLELF